MALIVITKNNEAPCPMCGEPPDGPLYTCAICCADACLHCIPGADFNPDAQCRDCVDQNDVSAPVDEREWGADGGLATGDPGDAEAELDALREAEGWNEDYQDEADAED